MINKKSLIALLAAALLSIPLGFASGEPQNVSGLTATTVDSTSIRLSWNSAKDATGGLVNHYRVYYGTTSVQTVGQGDYDKMTDTPNNNTSFTVGSLTPATKYYFSVTAVDAANVESEAYSLEANATTLTASGAVVTGDTTAPTVTGATAPDKNQVVVTFSESVKLPDALPELAFTVNEQAVSTTLLTVSAARLGGDGKSVVLTTGDQTANVSYVVTAGVAVSDVSGNPMVSGNTDSAVFLGSALSGTPVTETPVTESPVQTVVPPVTTPEPTPITEVPVAEPVVTSEPVVVEPAPVAEAPKAVEPLDCGNSDKCFYEYLRTCAPVTMVVTNETSETRRTAVPAEKEGDCSLTYSVAAITDLTNPKTLTCNLEVKGLEDRVKQVVEKADGRLFKSKDEIKELCSGDYLDAFLAEFKEVDITPPENVTNLMLSFQEQLQTFVVMLKWTASLNSAGDLVDQLLYMSLDRGKTYDSGKSLGATATSDEVANLEGGKEYTFKVTTKDATGNESTGVVKSIRLPQTGAAAGVLLLMSGIGAFRALRRKQQ